MSEAYTYFYVVEEDKEGGFTEHKIIDRFSICDYADKLENVDLEWFDRCGTIDDTQAYIETVLNPIIENEDHDPDDYEEGEGIQDLIDFLNKYQENKVMVFSEPHYSGG